ncbi:MAG: hypothetical protein KAW82_01555 [Desulfurellaceae bacterium]|nr:hypothetical protein [Desulfurellaceae bacterium]
MKGKKRLCLSPHQIDFLIEGQVILEIKATDGMRKKVGLLINFNVERLKDGMKRLVL